MELSISGIARLTGKSERTIARWIQNGQIAATRRENGMYDVDEQALLAKRPQDENTVILARLAEIQAMLLTQADQIQNMAARLDDLARAGPRAGRKQIARAPSSPRVTPSESALPTQPTLLPSPDVTQASSAGVVAMPLFAKQHFPGVDPARVDRLTQTLREQGIPLQRGSFKNGQGKSPYGLDAAGRRAFWERTHERAGFHPCDDCPHAFHSAENIT